MTLVLLEQHEQHEQHAGQVSWTPDTIVRLPAMPGT
jgi:hypothetical protein